MDKAPWQERVRALLAPLVSLLARSGVSPTALTLSGLVLHVLTGVVIATGELLAGGILLLVAAACDSLDGALARRIGKVSRFGAFLDSTVDRVDETAVLGGVLVHFLRLDTVAGMVWSVVVLVGLAGSLITSYTRARAEGLGLDCKVGVFERPERVIVTALGLLLGDRVLVVAIVMLTVLSWLTVAQRVRHVHRLLQGEDPQSVQMP